MISPIGITLINFYLLLYTTFIKSYYESGLTFDKFISLHLQKREKEFIQPDETILNKNSG